jgi:hypothetical protein
MTAINARIQAAVVADRNIAEMLGIRTPMAASV